MGQAQAEEKMEMVRQARKKLDEIELDIRGTLTPPTGRGTPPPSGSRDTDDKPYPEDTSHGMKTFDWKDPQMKEIGRQCDEEFAKILRKKGNNPTRVLDD